MARKKSTQNTTTDKKRKTVLADVPAEQNAPDNAQDVQEVQEELPDTPDMLFAAGGDSGATSRQVETLGGLVIKALPYAPDIKQRFFDDSIPTDASAASAKFVDPMLAKRAVSFTEVTRNTIEVTFKNGSATGTYLFNGEDDQLPRMTCERIIPGTNRRYRTNQVPASADVTAMIPDRSVTVILQDIEFICEPRNYTDTAELVHNMQTTEYQQIKFRCKDGLHMSADIYVVDDRATTGENIAKFHEYVLPASYGEASRIKTFTYECADANPATSSWSVSRSSFKLCTVSVSNLSHDTYYYIIGQKIPSAKIILHSDGNVVVRDIVELKNIPDASIGKNDGDSIVLMSPQTLGRIKTQPSDPKAWRVSVSLINDIQFERPEMSLLGTQSDSYDVEYSITTIDPSTSQPTTHTYHSPAYDLYMSHPDLFWQFAPTDKVVVPNKRDYIVEDDTLDYTIQQNSTTNEITNSKGPYHIAIRGKKLFNSQNIKIYIAYSDPQKFRVSTMGLI